MGGFAKNVMLLFKNFYFRLFYSRKINPTVRFYGRGIILRGGDITIGEDSTVNNYVILNATHSQIVIGKKCRISDGVKITALGLDDSKKHISSPVVIEDNVWLGMGCIILPGVKIGQNSIIGAGAVVTKDVASNVVAAGVPAKIIRQLDESL